MLPKSRFKRALSLVAILGMSATFATVVTEPAAQAAPPSSADADVQAIWNGLDALQSSSQGLATDGAFGQALHDVELTPGGSDGIGFGDLFQKAFADRLTAANPMHLSDLVNALKTSAPVDLESNGRNASISATSSTAGTVESLAFDLTVNRRVASAPMTLAITSPKFDFTAPVQVDLALHASFTVAYDSSTGAVYFDTTSSAPAFTLAADAHFPCATASAPPCTQDASGVHAGVGILGVSLTSGSSFDLTTNLRASLRDPNGDGRVYLGTVSGGTFHAFAEPNGSSTNPGELSGGAASAAGMVAVSFGGAPGSLVAQLNLAAAVDPALTTVTLPGVSANVAIVWPDITTGSPSATVSGVGLSSINAFQNLSPQDLAQGLAGLATALEGIQMSRTYTPTDSGKTGTTAAIAEGAVTSTYTSTHGGAPEVGDLLRIGGTGAPVRDVVTVDGTSSPYTVTFGSPLNAAVAAGTTVTQVDSKGNIDLPFMKGTLADIFQANEAITAFLAKHVTQTYNALANANSGTLSAATAQTASYTVVAGAAPQNGEYYRIGSATKKVTAVSGTGPYALTFDAPFASAPSDGTAAVQVQLGDLVPNFSSLQSMLADLKTTVGLPGGSTFSVGDVNYDNATAKLTVGLSIARAAGTAQDLDAFQKVAWGTVSAVDTDPATGAPTLKETGRTWQANVYAGHRVRSGSSSNIVKSNTGDTLVFIGAWHGAAPAVGDAFDIGGQDSQTGAISFANKLNTLSGATGSGILNANAQIPLAKVTPSYSVNLTLALDLQATQSGAGCDGLLFNGVVNHQACPFTANNPDGTSTVVQSLPTVADRVMLRTADSSGPLHLLTADAPIDSAVEVNATVGFLGLQLKGQLHECSHFASDGTCPDPASADHHLLSVDFKSGLGDAQHDLSLSKVFAILASDPASLAGVAVTGQVHASITPHITGIPGLSDSDFFGTAPTFTLTMDDITDPSSITFDTGGFGTALDKIKAFNFDTSNPKALFGEVLQNLKTLSKLLKTVGDNGNSTIQSVLGTKIPVVGLRLGDIFNASEQGQGANVTFTDTTLTDTDAHFTDSLLLRTVVAGTSTGVVTATTATTLTVRSWQGGTPAAGAQYQVENALDSAIDLLTANPADSLQQVIALVNERLGALSVPITISVDTSGSKPILGLQVDWKRDFYFTTPVAFDFKLGSDDNSIVGSQAKGLVQLHAKAEAKVKLLLPLGKSDEAGASEPSGLQVDPTNTSLAASVDAGASGYLKANFGPLAIALGEPVDTGATHPAEAHATFSASLGSGDSAPESISTFLSNVASSGIQFNQATPAVTCGGDSTANLALCAAFPVYLSTDGGTTYQAVHGAGSTDPDTLRLRLPLSGSLSDEFKLTDDTTGTILPVDPSDTTVKRLEIPADLLDDLKNAVLDFSQLGGGLDGYFKFAEQALNLASFGGKLPIIGKDLQEGAQFLEGVQADVDGVLGDLASVSDEQGLKDWINNQLNNALTDVLPSGSKVTADFICSATLATPGGVSATAAVTTAPTTAYKYRVSATDPKGETLASAAVTGTSAALSATNFVTVKWTKVAGAAGYNVYRSSDGGTTWKKFTAAQATAPSFKDVGDAGATGTPKDSGTNPVLEPCPLTSISGVTLAADLGQGDISADQGCADNGASKCLGGHIPLDIGVPGLSLAAATQDDGTPDPDQELSVKLGWKIHMKIGLDLHRGFFVETQDSKDPEIALGLAISLPKAIQANISFLKINLCDFRTGQTYGPGKSCPFTPIVPTDVTRTPAAGKPLFAGEFGLDLHTPTATKTAFSSPAFTVNDDAANDITLANLTNLAGLKKLVTVGLSAKVHIDWDFQALADAALPGVGGEFKLDWQWGSTLGAPTVATDTGKDAAPPVDSSNPPDISFNNVYISAGGFLSGVLRPIIKEVQQFTSPLKPVIDTLYAPIPVLSDLSHLAGGGDVTLISIAEAFSTLAGGPDLTMVERILQVIKMVNAIPDGDDNLGIFIGSFHLNATKAINTTATPDNTDALIDPAKKTPATPAQNGGKSAAGAMDTASGGKVGDAKSKGGFSFPLLDNPSSVFNLLMGGDVDLIRFDSGNLKLGFAYSQQFGPVYAPPPVVITISGSASVSARIIAGFDTYGLRKAYEAIKSGQGASSVIGSILDSLFLYTVDPTKDDGVPVPVLTLQGELAAGASVTVLIVSVGIEGGIRLTINFYWNDPNNDGKFRSSEFLKTALRNPLCLFNVDGQLSVFLRLNVTIGFGPFSHTFSFTLVDVVLLDFSVHPNCSPPPPELGEVQDHVLYLFFGALGKSAQRGDPWGNTNEDETIKVHELHDADGAFTGFGVDGLSRHEEFLDNSITTVVLDAKDYAGAEKLFITGDSNQAQPVSAGPPTTNPFDKAAVVYGGTASDNIKIDGGAAYVDGGAGDDTINLSGNETSAVAGGPGNDNITVGNGADYVAGDSALPVTGSVTLGNHRQVGDPAPQGSWSDVANVPNATGNPGAGEAGTDGNDSVLAGYGANHLYGNGGNDSVSIATDKPLVSGETRQPGVNAASANTVVGGTGDNNIHGGAGGDTIYAGQQWGATSDEPNYAGLAGDGRNQVDTGAGTDTVYGGSNTDFVVGHSTSAQVDTFYGGDGGDVLVGGYGTDHLYGGGDADYISGGPATVDALDPADATLGAWKITPTAAPSGTTVGAKTLVGGDGADHITGAGGGDFIYGDRQEDTCALPTTGPRSTPPAETNSGSPGNDYIVGGNGNNRISGGGGDDTLFAGSGNDLLCGGAGLDKAYGGAGMDTLFGGSDKDLLVAGTGNSSLYGNTGNDNVIAGAGNDWLEGNAGSDTMDGGTGQSVIIGGTSAAAQNDAGDTIFGGAGNNIIFGDNGKVDENSGWPNSGKPFVEPVVAHAYDLGTDAPDNTTYGGNDTITGGSGDVAVYGGVGDDSIVGGTGSDHLEGGPGSDTIYGGTNNDDILGGTSPRAVAGASVDLIPDGSDGSGTDVTPATLGSVSPVVGNTIYGFLPFGPNPMHANVIVGGNGSIILTGATDANTGAPVRAVLQYALTTIGGNDTITGGPGPEQIFGGLGNDVIHTGNGENYVEGNPGADRIFGGTGSNDIIGGTSPLTLPTTAPDVLTTDLVSDGGDTIYADGRTAAPPAGTPQEGGNVVLADNGCISRGTTGAATLANGCPTGPSTNPAPWVYSKADPNSVTAEHAKGNLVRAVVRQLDVFDCPAGCGSIDVQGAGDHVWGGTGDDLLFGERGDDEVYGGPPGTNGLNGTAGTAAGNDYLEGGAGSDTVAGGAGDDDMIGGSAPTYLPAGRTTALISDGTSGGSGITLPLPANPLLVLAGSGVLGNTMDGGDGADVMLGGNGTISHVLTSATPGVWSKNANDAAFIRTQVDLDLLTIGGDDTMRGGPGDDRMFGALGNDNAIGGVGDDYLEGGPGRNALQGSEGDDDLVGGTSPIALPPPPSGKTNDQVAADTPNGTADPAHAGQRLGNIVCGFLCGQSTGAGDDDSIAANNARIDRCAPAGGVAKGSDSCTWGKTSYGNAKVVSAPGTAQSGGITNTPLGNVRTRYVTLLGQNSTQTTSNGNDYVEGDSGNDVIMSEDGSDAVHGDTPTGASPRLDECLPTSDANAGQDVIVGGYGNDVLCGDGGDDGVVGNRGTVTIVPFANAAATIGTTGGAPYGTLKYPGSGNTIYQVNLSQEYVNGVATAVPNWDKPTTTGQDKQHDIVFGGQGNDTLHGSPGDDFLQGDDGMHITGDLAARGGDDIVFADRGNDSMQGGPGNDNLFGGDGNDDHDVIRSDSAIALKVTDARGCLPMMFPTITVAPNAMLTAEGCSAATLTGFGIQSYASRFPLIGSATYDSDPGAADNGGTTANTNVFGDVAYGGFNRDVFQSQATGLGDRMIDDFGAYNLEVVCPGAYGGWQINRALSPTLRTFLQALSQADGAVNTSTPTSSGGTELSLIYAGDSKSNTGPDYPTTPGHFTC